MIIKGSSCIISLSVAPAKAGAQNERKRLDSGFCWNECAWEQARSERLNNRALALFNYEFSFF